MTALLGQATILHLIRHTVRAEWRLAVCVCVSVRACVCAVGGGKEKEMRQSTYMAFCMCKSQTLCLLFFRICFLEMF